MSGGHRRRVCQCLHRGVGNVNARLIRLNKPKNTGGRGQHGLRPQHRGDWVELPMPKINDGIAEVSQKLRPDGSVDAATAMMTHGHKAQLASRTFILGDATVTITGWPRARTIHPNMAMML